MRFLTAAVLLFSFLLGNGKWSVAQPGPSFDCEKATGLIALTICTNSKLAALDQLLGRSYREQVSNAEDSVRIYLREQQRAWIQTRNAQCGRSTDIRTLENCLSRTILDRLNAYNSAPLSEEASSLMSIDEVKEGYFRLTVCNNAPRQASLALAHRLSVASGRFIISGWYKVEPGSCEAVGDFPQGNFYYFAQAGSLNWAGTHSVCVQRGNFKRFDVPGSTCADDMLRPFATATIEESAFTINLASQESAESASQGTVPVVSSNELQSNKAAAALKFIVSLNPECMWEPDGITLGEMDEESGDRFPKKYPYDQFYMVLGPRIFGLAGDVLMVVHGPSACDVLRGLYRPNQAQWNKAVVALKALGVEAPAPGTPLRIDVRRIK